MQTDARDIVINHKLCGCERGRQRGLHGRFCRAIPNRMRGLVAEYDVPCPRCTEHDVWRTPRNPRPISVLVEEGSEFVPVDYVEYRRAWLTLPQEWAWVDARAVAP